MTTTRVRHSVACSTDPPRLAEPAAGDGRRDGHSTGAAPRADGAVRPCSACVAASSRRRSWVSSWNVECSMSKPSGEALAPGHGRAPAAVRRRRGGRRRHDVDARRDRPRVQVVDVGDAGGLEDVPANVVAGVDAIGRCLEEHIDRIAEEAPVCAAGSGARSGPTRRCPPRRGRWPRSRAPRRRSPPSPPCRLAPPGRRRAGSGCAPRRRAGATARSRSPPCRTRATASMSPEATSGGRTGVATPRTG